MQLELFKLEKDDRIDKVCDFVVDMVIKERYRKIRAKDVQEIALKFKVVDKIVLDIYEKTLKDYDKLNGDYYDDDDDDDEICTPVYGSCVLPRGHKGKHQASLKASLTNKEEIS